jgi:hypothetical protein
MHDRRLTLRLLMAIVAAWGLALAWFRAQGSLSYALVVISHSIIAWGLALIAALAMARGFGPIILGAAKRATVSGLLAIILLASLYLAWGHHRAMYEYIHGLDHGFPYPDRAINGLERWFDARHPLPPGGFIKLHGEYPRVGFVLGILVLVFMSASGWLIGVLSNRPACLASRQILPVTFLL